MELNSVIFPAPNPSSYEKNSFDSWDRLFYVESGQILEEKS